MSVRVHYRGTELMSGEIEDFPEADVWETTASGEVVLYQRLESESGKYKRIRVGMVAEGTWLSVIAVERDDE